MRERKQKNAKQAVGEALVCGLLQESDGKSLVKLHSDPQGTCTGEKKGDFFFLYQPHIWPFKPRSSGLQPTMGDTQGRAIQILEEAGRMCCSMVLHLTITCWDDTVN